jgi:hypothetical protein
MAQIQFKSLCYLFGKRKEKAKRGRGKAECRYDDRKEIAHILELNTVLAEHALLLPVFSTAADFEKIEKLVTALPGTETALVEAIGLLAIQPRLRVLQKLGRLDKHEPFKTAAKFVDAATLSFYHGNYISSFMTLAPVIEGILIRWMGYSGNGESRSLKKYASFLNILTGGSLALVIFCFTTFFQKPASKLSTNTSTSLPQGGAHAHFNRHLASHLLRNAAFATKENCIRLFILLDALSEIYVYENRHPDPRFHLDNADLSDQIRLFPDALIEGFHNTPERKILDTIP